MTEQEIIRAAASIRGKKRWTSFVKKAGGIKAAKKQMRALRARRVIPKTSEKA
jgi:hypothetical protein